MKYGDKIKEAKTLDELFELWKNKESDESINHSNDYFIADGIVNEDVWNSNTKKRILYVLKEAYGTDWGDYTLVTWLRDKHPSSKIWNRIAKWTYGLQNTNKSFIQPYKNKLSTNEHNDFLEQIAVMNLKKSKGKSQSDSEEIAFYAKHDSNEIKKEFELIDADVIVCGYTFRPLYKALFENDFENSGIEANENWFYYLEYAGKKRLFIDYYHPSNYWSDLINYYGLIGIYQQALNSDKA